VRPFLLSATVTELNGEACIIAICRDITTIKQTEERLRAEIVRRTRAQLEQAQFAAIVNASHDAIINISPETKVLSWNPAAEKAYGYTAKEAIGQGIELFVPPEELAETLAANRRVVETGQSVSWEQHALKHDGTPFVTAVSIFPIYDLAGKIAGVGGIGRDITKLKEVERELRENERQLVAAREAALAASQAKSEFLSSMSHEIRTPMNAILGMAQLLEETPLNPDQKKYLEIMTNSGDALLDLINGILDLAKIESGRLSLEEAGFDLESVVDAAVETLGVRAHQKGLEMLAHVKSDVPMGLVGDRLRLRQVLLNLIGNAVKFTEHGQVLLTVERDRESVEPGHLHFSVADTGIGIPEDKLEEVFSNFTQADSSTTRQYGGSGLGLAIVRRLVALMGGRAWSRASRVKAAVFISLRSSDFKMRSPPRRLRR
jgi:two-component system, sensor histidine kinase and response regulator